MKRPPLYSRSDPGRRATPPDEIARSVHGHEGPGEATPTDRGGRSGNLRAFARRHERTVLVGSGGAIVLLFALLFGAFRSDAPVLTQRDIDQAVLHTLENQPIPPSLESQAYRVIGPSIVQVRRLDPDGEAEEDPPETGDRGSADSHPSGDGWVDPDEPAAESDRPRTSPAVGTGVVIVDDGTILTNLHVVAGIDRLGVVFADGTESPARIVSIRPDLDLAVIQADFLPDDLIPATLSSTADLRVGDRVIAVGFPFGIGPSLSSGVVSGLRREYWSQEGDRILSNLIQFDAAANPGNSGGPLVTVDGFVVGIVTAILNPNNQRSFVGIGFAVPIEEAAAAVGSSPF